MDAHVAGVLIPILVSLGLFAMIFGIVYLRNREKMAMIERGMDPRISTGKSVSRNYVLTFGLLLMGSGIGLFLAYLLDNSIFSKIEGNPAVYFSLIAVFGGSGLFVSYLIEKKDAKKLEE